MSDDEPQEPGGPIGRYVALWRVPGVPRVMLPALLARLPVAVEPLAIFVYLVHQTGSYAVGGAGLALFSGALAVVWPLHGRLIDRHGLRPIVGGLALLHALTLLVFPFATNGPLWLTLAAVAAPALTLAPIGSTVRAAWALILPRGPRLDTANALEAVLVEVLFVIGPALAGGLTGLIGPLPAILVAGGVQVVGSLGYASAPAVARLRPERPTAGARARSPLRLRGVLPILVAAGSASAAFAVLEVAVPATVAEGGSSAATGVALLSLTPLGSVIGGLVYGARRHSRPPFVRYMWLLVAATCCLLPVALTSNVILLGAILLLAGLPMAPVNSEEFSLLGSLVPASALNETFALTATAMAVGSAAGNLLGGAVAGGAGPGWARLLAPVASAAAILVVWSVRATLQHAGKTDVDAARPV